MDYEQESLRRPQKVQIPKPKPLSSLEKSQVNHQLAFRGRIHDGPLYAVIGKTSDVEQYATFEAAQFDPFEGVPTYSNIYKKKQRTLPQLNTRTYGKRRAHPIKPAHTDQAS